MHRQIHFYVLGSLCAIEGVFLLPSVVIAFFEGEGAALRAFTLTIALLLLCALFLLRKKPDLSQLSPRDGYVIAAEGWILISFFGALPFYFSGAFPGFVDCLFESVSGFTTTGASILLNIEGLPLSILFWRSFTHWIGGMGILVFMLALIKMAGGKSIYIMRAESPGPSVDKLVPKIRNSAAILYGLYIFLTFLEVFLLCLGGMPLFDSLCNSFATAGTGGFAIKNASIAAYASPYIQWVIAIFMFLFGVNFNVYFLIAIGRFREGLRQEELRWYAGIMGAVILLITFNIRGLYGNLYEAFRQSAFQVSSIMTTTGFATADFDLWPEFSRALLVLVMFIGASAGSTGGGLKVSRVVLLLGMAKRELRRAVDPRRVEVVRLNGRVVEEEVLSATGNYLFIYLLIFIISTICVSLGNYDLETSFTAVAACLNNIGPGLSLVGPTSNFAFFAPFEKIVLMLNMLLGRLEALPLLLLAAPLFHRRGTRRKNAYLSARMEGLHKM